MSLRLPRYRGSASCVGSSSSAESTPTQCGSPSTPIPASCLDRSGLLVPLVLSAQLVDPDQPVPRVPRAWAGRQDRPVSKDSAALPVTPDPPDHPVIRVTPDPKVESGQQVQKEALGRQDPPARLESEEQPDPPDPKVPPDPVGLLDLKESLVLLVQSEQLEPGDRLVIQVPPDPPVPWAPPGQQALLGRLLRCPDPQDPPAPLAPEELPDRAETQDRRA
jgi:hypothetical protein